MDAQLLERQFTRIGARAKFRHQNSRDRTSGLSMDIGRDRAGEFFDLALPRDGEIETQVLDVKPTLRHLLLMTAQADGKHKFLCGHDERHWFVAAVPERASVTSVESAFDALKPPAVRQLETRLRVKPRKRNLRRNEAFVRQGEWFFIPVRDDSFIDERLVLRYEPMFRSGGGKPHYCEELVRQGGQLVYVSSQYPSGLTEGQRRQLLSQQPALRRLHWVSLRRSPSVFVRGRVRHSDHKTIVLNGWHQVHMNTENEAVAMRHVAFID